MNDIKVGDWYYNYMEYEERVLYSRVNEVLDSTVYW